LIETTSNLGDDCPSRHSGALPIRTALIVAAVRNRSSEKDGCFIVRLVCVYPDVEAD
jgi:hypothetical protein